MIPKNGNHQHAQRIRDGLALLGVASAVPRPLVGLRSRDPKTDGWTIAPLATGFDSRSLAQRSSALGPFNDVHVHRNGGKRRRGTASLSQDTRKRNSQDVPAQFTTSSRTASNGRHRIGPGPTREYRPQVCHWHAPWLLISASDAPENLPRPRIPDRRGSNPRSAPCPLY